MSTPCILCIFSPLNITSMVGLGLPAIQKLRFGWELILNVILDFKPVSHHSGPPANNREKCLFVN